jgi:hypothetical protein
MMKEYWKDNWDGWPLHSLLAGLFIWVGYHYPMEVLLGANIGFWPAREAAQHDGWGNIWTAHRIIEWGCPVVVGFVVYGVMT